MSNVGAFDPSGVAAGALRAAVSAQGPRVLQHTSQLRSALSDLNTQAPREAGILLLAADAGVAGMLTQQVNQQGVDPAGAIRLSSGQLGERTSLDPNACTWATTAFADALGLVPPGSAAGVAAAGDPAASPWTGGAGDVAAAGGLGAAAGAVGAGWGDVAAPGGLPPGVAPGQNPAAWPEQTLAADPTAAGWSGQAPAAGWGAPPTTEGWVAQGPSAPAPSSDWGTSNPAPGWPPSPSAPSVPGAAAGWTPPAAGPPTGSGWGSGGGGASGGQRRPVLIGTAIVVVVLILGYFGAAAGAHLPPFSKSSSTAAASTTTTRPPSTTTPSTTVPATTTTTTTIGPFTPQSKTVAQLMPADIPQSTDCQSFTPPVTGLVGLGAALECLDPSLPGGTVFGLQFGSTADYASSVTAFNNWLGFDTATAGQSCPPASGGQGAAPWYDAGFPQLSGQNVECLTVGTTHDTPAFAWFYPNQDVIFDAQGATDSTLLTLSTWWTDHGDAAGAA